MLVIPGFFDGEKIQTPNGPKLRKNQKVLITLIDEQSPIRAKSPMGLLAKYADPKKRPLEKDAFAKAQAEKHSRS